MDKMTRWMACCSLAALLNGCVTSTITNLTASQQARNDKGLYPIEMAWDSNQQAQRAESLKAYVVVGFNRYEMQPALIVSNRWETLVPLPADQELLHYHFKVDYEFNDFGKRGQGSKLSREYKLNILEK